MEFPERIWQLMAKMLNHEATASEEAELRDLLQKNSSLQQQYDLLIHIWKEKEDKKRDEEDAKRHILKIINRAETEQVQEDFVITHKRRRRRNYITLALLLLIIGGTFITYISFKRTASSAGNQDQEVLIAKNGSRIRSLLPDGTTVWLNAGSQLFMENDFSGATREVRLEGEAFFDVVKNPERPFIVHASGIDIKVLGTAFNVKAYPEDETVETTLLRGLVQVYDQKDTKKAPIELRPNQKLVLPKQAATGTASVSQTNEPPVIQPMPRFTITRIDSTKKEDERFETAWVYSRLEFRGDSFETLARKLERWYNVTIVFTDEKVKQLNFNGSFEKETVDQAFVALKEANAFVYKINENHEISVGSSQ